MFTSSILLASCAAFAAAAPASASVPVKFPVGKGLNHYVTRDDGDLDGPAVLSALNGTLQKYQADPLPEMSGISTLIGGILKRATGAVALTDQVEQQTDELYYGSAKIGASSPQTFTLDFDTGSADLFVPGPRCTTAQGCVGTTKYSQKGKSEGNTTSVTYGSGSVSGANYFDTVCAANLCAQNTNVISLTTASGFSTSASEGLMGLGFSTIANSKQPTFFENLVSAKKLSKNEFSFYLGRAKSGTQGGSELTFGGADASKYTGNPKANPVTTKGYWQIALDAVTVKGKKALGSAGQAAIDTGTTLIIAPTTAATAIYALIPGALPVPLASGSATTTIFAYPCNTKAIPAITFGGTSYSINPLDFNLGKVTLDFAQTLAANGVGGLLEGLLGLGSDKAGGLCLGGIAGADLNPAQPLYVVGDTFLKSWYSTYNSDGAGSVSFAKAV